jgi:hypothetical protein
VRKNFSTARGQFNLKQENLMTTHLKSTLPFALAAGTLAVAVAGCGTFDRDRSADRASDRYSNRTVERVTTTDTVVATNAPVVSTNTPASVDPFSSRYVSFPAMDNETAGPIALSNFCQQHYSQLGCQSSGAAANEGSLRRDRPMRRSDAGEFRSDTSSSVPNRY